jgi:acyl carrier protein
MLNPVKPAQIETAVHATIRALAEARGSKVDRLAGADKLYAKLGLDSLDLAELVASLEAELGVDPFAKLVSITSVVSVDDVVQAYQRALFPQVRRAEVDDVADAAVKRAAARQARSGRR